MTNTEKEDRIYQVNVSYDYVNDEYGTDIVPFDERGYQGRTTDTTYEDGVSYTDWCSFVGSQSQCEDWVRRKGWMP